MTPNKLILKNFIGIKSGLGLDEITIDFDALSEGADLIAIHGTNGKGKSTILDNLTPFRIMASRANSYSPGSFSYYDQTVGDATKVLYWTHNNVGYRTTILIKASNKTKKTEAYLHQQDGEGNWSPCRTGEGSAVSDGKTATYDKAVELVLGTPEMFFTSAFASQGKTPLSSYTNGEIKSLMAELLGLDHISDLGDKAYEVVKGLITQHSVMQGTLVSATANEDNLNKLQDSLSHTNTQLGMYTQARHAARDAVQKATDHLARVKSDSVSQADIQEKRAGLLNEIQKLSADADQRTAELKRDMEALRNDYQASENKYNQDVATINNSITRAEKSISECEQLISQKQAIEDAIEAIDQKTAVASDIDIQLLEIDKLITLRDKYRNALDRLRHQLADAAHRLKTESTQLDNLRAQSALVDEVPCNGMDIQVDCRLLKSAMDAREKITDQEKKVEDLYAQHEEIKTRTENGKSELEKFSSVDSDKRNLLMKKDSLMMRINELRAIAARKELVDSADQSIINEQNELTQLNQRLQEIKQSFDVHKQAINDRLGEYGQKIADVESAKKANILSIQEALSALPSLDSENPLTEAQANLSAAETRLQEAEKEMDKHASEAARLKANIDVLNNELNKSANIKTVLSKLNAEIARWKLLSKALGKDGIIALSIDDAGPTIAKLANDLLLRCYGPRFTVAIDTQSETAKGALKETFDITVFDADRDEKKSIKTMSGGERVYINECITRAIALYQADQSQQRYDTLFTDETDGALDPDRKIMFFKMKRAVLELGGYEREYFISHTPELIDMADAVIDLSDFERQSAA